ncbi:MAG: hypothetical protein A2Z16_14750 [Chloroflexi bacterium RBG_16_54_18]|nr:MAG: hypothetical protein A2Z16_14750 [Chloroflexi bacterium RBG_16_54_18]
MEGITVVYSHGGALWAWSKGIKNQIITRGPVYSPLISPDGAMVAFLRPVDDFYIELWTINLDGTDERRLVGTADLEAIGGSSRDPNAVAIVPHRFQWLPESHTLAFNSEYAYQGPGTVLLDDFNLIDAGTGKLSYQLLTSWGGEFFLSPSGDQIAISTPTNVILANLDGSNWRSVFAYEPVITYSDYRYYASPVWSPDGSYLLLALPPADPLSEPSEPTKLFRIDAASSSTQEIGQVDSVPFFDIPVQYSPDLSQIAYLASAGGAGKNRRSLLLASPDGSGSILYQEGELLQFLEWNPPGHRFGFSLGEDQELYIGYLNIPAVKVDPPIFGVIDMRWINEDYFVYLQGIGEKYNLCLSAANGASIIIASVVNSRIEFDYFWKKNLDY